MDSTGWKMTVSRRRRAMGASIRCGAVMGLFLLGGCSDEPSESDMRELVEANTAKEVTRAGRPFTGFTEFRKQGCVDSRHAPGAFDCYYLATFIPAPGAKPLTVNGKARFTRTDKGLTYRDLGAQPK